MEAITKVSLEKIKNSQIDNLNGRNEFTAFTQNGGLFNVQNMLNEIGNNELDSWANVEKIKRSTSNKNICTYLNKFIDQLTKIGF